MNNQFEIIVLGGGISGLGVARQAARSGFEVLLIEKDKCVSAASANSLRIIHGGFRYLQNLDIVRVLHSLRAQQDLLREFPEFIKPLPCVMPLDRWGLKSRFPAAAGHALYSGFHRYLGGGWNEGGVKSTSFVAGQIPLLRGMAAHGVLSWQDAVLARPDEFHDALQSEIKDLGGVICEGTKVEAIKSAGRGFEVVCRQGKEVMLFSAGVVVNCLGAWVNCISKPGLPRLVRTKWCKAFNIVVRQQLERRFAIGVKSREGRLFFVAPRGENSAIGTWYLPYEGSPDEMKVEENELNAFIQAFNQVLPGGSVSIGDVLKVEAGVLPMFRERRAGPELYGMSRIYQNGAYLEILSTKYTTGISQGRDIMYRAARCLAGHS